MSIKGLFFFCGFLICSASAFVSPHLGIYGYIIDYCIGPAQAWWGAPFAAMGVRFSLTLSLATAAGMMLQWRKLQFESWLVGQEVLMILFLGIIWLSVAMGKETVSLYSTTDHPSLKMLKVFVLLFMMSHLITDIRKLDGLFWVFVAVSFYIGTQAWQAPSWKYWGGRLEGIGGPDFAEANYLAAFMSTMLPIIGIQFLRSKKLFGKIFCSLSAAFTVNTIVLCRSRGALFSIVVGVLIVCLLSPKIYRKKIYLLLILGILGGFYVTDEQFWDRGKTIIESEESRDESALSRFHLWSAGVRMVEDHPFGVGVGNWFQSIGAYLPEYEGEHALDSHNLYVKCFAELGIHGGVVFLWIISVAFWQLWRIRQMSMAGLLGTEGRDLLLLSFALMLSLTIMLCCGITITTLYTESTWLMLMLPVCLIRISENILLENGIQKQK